MKFWIYNIGYFFLEIPFRVFFKTFFINGAQHLPKDKPILFVANHSGSFLDGVVLCYARYHKLFAMARGDAFNKPIGNKLLRSVRLLPIYRSRDAEAEKAREGNERTYSELYELFRTRSARILIFPEASSSPEKTLRPLKKGAANIVADMMLRSNGELDLYVVPCGINFSQFFKMRGRLMVNFGQAISAKERYPEIKENPRKFGVRFTDEIEQALNGIVVKTSGSAIAEKEFLHEVLLNECDTFTLYRQYNRGEDVSERLTDLNPDQKEKTKVYMSALKAHGVSDRSVGSNSFNALSIFFALVTAAVSLPASFVYYLLCLGSKRGAGSFKLGPLFFDSLYFGLLFIIGFLWHILVVVGCFVFLPEGYLGVWKLAAASVAIAATPHWFTLFDEARFLQSKLRFLGLSQADRNELIKLREDLLSSL